MSQAPFRVRAARDEDRVALATLFAAVAAERTGIATEPPVDVEARAAAWSLDGDIVAEAEGALVGSIHVQVSRHGYGELGMAVAREWRGRGVGSA
jgi:GNAT superfamily N-acetyltransferase